MLMFPSHEALEAGPFSTHDMTFAYDAIIPEGIFTLLRTPLVDHMPSSTMERIVQFVQLTLGGSNTTLAPPPKSIPNKYAG